MIGVVVAMVISTTHFETMNVLHNTQKFEKVPKFSQLHI